MSNLDAVEYNRIKELLKVNKFHGGRNVGDVKKILDRADNCEFKIGLI